MKFPFKYSSEHSLTLDFEENQIYWGVVPSWTWDLIMPNKPRRYSGSFSSIGMKDIREDRTALANFLDYLGNAIGRTVYPLDTSLIDETNMRRYKYAGISFYDSDEIKIMIYK